MFALWLYSRIFVQSRDFLFTWWKDKNAYVLCCIRTHRVMTLHLFKHHYHLKVAPLVRVWFHCKLLWARGRMHDILCTTGLNLLILKGRIFYKICRKKDRLTFVTVGNINIWISIFQDHGKSAKHGRLTWAIHKGERTMKRGIVEANLACNEAMYFLFQTTYYIRIEVIPFHKFPNLCSLLVKVKANMMEKLYHDEIVVKLWWDFILHFISGYKKNVR